MFGTLQGDSNPNFKLFESRKSEMVGCENGEDEHPIVARKKLKVATKVLDISNAQVQACIDASRQSISDSDILGNPKRKEKGKAPTDTPPLRIKKR